MSIVLPDPQGLLLAGTLLLDIADPLTGQFTGYASLEADKLEVKTPSDTLPKRSKSRERWGQELYNQQMPKPSEITITFNEVTAPILATQLAGIVNHVNRPTGAAASVDVTVIPGRWVDIGFDYVDEATLTVTPAAGGAAYVKGTDYLINPRLGLLYAPAGGAIAAGTVKVSAGKLAYTANEIQAAQQYSFIMKAKLDGINKMNRKDGSFYAPQISVNPESAWDLLSGKLAEPTLKGMCQVPAGWTMPFIYREYTTP